MTRRSILIGAVASLICAPAVVRATSLMPVRGFPLQILNPMGEFYRRCLYHSLDHGLRTGRMIASINGKIISVADAPDGRVCAGTGMAATGTQGRRQARSRP